MGPKPDTETANSILTALVYQRRLLHRYSEFHEQSRLGFAEQLEQERQLRRFICSELGLAMGSGEISLRPQFTKVVSDPAWGERTILNLNWDELIEHSGLIQAHALDHIHGSIRDPDTLYLPSEYSAEPHYGAADLQTQYSRHRKMRDAIALCDGLVIYGSSLSLLDAELCSMLQMGIRRNWERARLPVQVHIFDLRDAIQEVWTRLFALQYGGVAVRLTAHPVEDL